MQFDSNQVNILLQLPVVGLFCLFLKVVLSACKDYLEKQDVAHLEYLENRDKELKDSLEKVAKSLEILGNRVQQNTLIIIAMHPEMTVQERNNIINKL